MMYAALALFAGFQPPAAPAASACVAPPASTMVKGRTLSWYLMHEAVTIGDRTYEKYGLPRVLLPGDVEFLAAYRDGYFYADPTDETHDMIYFLVDIEECAFQPYRARAK